VEQNITKSVKDLNQSFNHLLKDINSELKEKIDEVTKSIVADVKQSCQEDIVSVNKIIEEKLRIPENVLLYADNLHGTKPTQADVDALSEECQRLEQNVKEVTIIDARQRFIKLYNICLITERFLHSRTQCRD
jgi:hypothetical protein